MTYIKFYFNNVNIYKYSTSYYIYSDKEMERNIYRIQIEHIKTISTVQIALSDRLEYKFIILIQLI